MQLRLFQKPFFPEALTALPASLAMANVVRSIARMDQIHGLRNLRPRRGAGLPPPPGEPDRQCHRRSTTRTPAAAESLYLLGTA